MFKVMVLLLLSVLILAGITSAYRLSRDVIPQHYSIKLRPHMEENSFEGEVTITLYTNYNTDKIILHSDSVLTITEVLVNQLPGFIKEEGDGRISVRFLDRSIFQPGEHRIYFKYTGILLEKFGLLKASYKYNNHTGFLIVNEFEPTHARKAFPCFDEPVFKANFNIRLVTPNDSYIAVSNMPEITRYSTSNGIIYNFATSVKMSTYLVSLAITDYSYYEDIWKFGNKKIPIRVYTYNASKENNKYAIEGAKTAVRFYSEYTGMDYPLPKLDMIEYNKVNSLATETWGLIQFKEGLLTKNLKMFDSWQCNLVIFHELAHFWFGNLVTNDWWNDLWLQEGFASFMSYKLIAKEYKSPDDLLIDMIELFEAEEEPGTLPLVTYLNSTDLIEKRFDNIIYRKGAFLLASLEAVVGQQTFQDVLKIFIKSFAYGTATTHNLISAFESNVLNTNIRSFLESYIYQTGFPMLNVNDSNGKYILTQVLDDELRKKWTIPISYTCGNNTTNLVWFDKDVDDVTITCPEDTNWILFNSVKQPGIYVVNYTETQWTNLLAHINELPKDEIDNLSKNAAVLYLSKQVNCDIILHIFDKLNKDLLNKMFKGIMSVARDIACFKSEYTIFVEYLNSKADTIDDIIQQFNSTCSEDENNNDEADHHVRQCAQWIRTNLVNYVKP